MRYLIRRNMPGDLKELEGKIPSLKEELGPPTANLRRSLKVVLSSSKQLLYVVMTQKTDTGFTWICPSLELVAETEHDLREMAQEFGVSEKLGHLRG